MDLDPGSAARVARVVRYGAAALIAAWSLLVLAGYAVMGTIVGWLASLGAGDGWMAWGAQLLGQTGGAVVAILWLAGTLVILGAMAVIRRFAT